MLRSPPSKSYSSPDLSTLSGIDESNKHRKRYQSDVLTAINTLTQDINKNLDDIRHCFNCAIANLSDTLTTIKTDLITANQNTSHINNELLCLRLEHLKLTSHISNVDGNQNALAHDVAGLKKTLQYKTDQQNEVKEVNNIANTIESSTAANDRISKLDAKIDTIDQKIDTLDQQSRHCNLEISNVPENTPEDLMALMNLICSKINCPLNQEDIVSIHRVPHAQSSNNKPKNIVVKFSSRVLRDKVLTAFQSAKGITTDEVGIPDVSKSIFMYEHLTLRKKQVLRTARQVVRRNNFKYVWVKHATIFVRQLDGSPVFAIRSTKDIGKSIQVDNLKLYLILVFACGCHVFF